ncbi:uncharacterized protein I303_104701 [Kwoniella dejecticola CBS 10117]|uniref:Type 1 phosphatases regulator n=1 Tax=Kwoniella dejecticola CBS 10117 TaxID=1296121 RepID=A0A1A6A4M1_9TREE|nr:uncharacterized protein I303_04320 [Kwoniella dejecticola CBS 10117]OBR84993.1 hypothetical protein I303_04320 [Kwoniella dejecticola CBS 10117]
MSDTNRQQSAPARGTAQTEIEAGPSNSSPEQPPAGVLKLRGGPLKKQRVVWSEETVDNEGMGKKKSKICCIYHKPKAFDESSDESSCSSSDDEHSHGPSKSNGRAKGHKHKHRSRDGGNGDAQVSDSQSSESDGGAGDGRARPARKPRKHQHSHDCDHDTGRVNKYDVQPKPSNSSSGAQNQGPSS